MAAVRRIVRLVGVALALGTYVWFAAVRNVGRVKRGKAARRRARTAGR